LVFSGCATTGQSTFKITPPEPVEISNEMIFDREFDTVWDELVRQLSRSFFVINNIDKESRLINVSFSVETPEDYIDCGTSCRTYDRGTEHISYEYPVASSNTYKWTGKRGAYNHLPITRHVRRQTSLDGRVNIYVAPEGDGTLVSVNSKYILTISISGTWTAENAMGMVTAQGNLDPYSTTISFSTNQPGKSSSGTDPDADDIICQSTGLLETQILELLNLVDK
jgi:hypothetical protein